MGRVPLNISKCPRQGRLSSPEHGSSSPEHGSSSSIRGRVPQSGASNPSALRLAWTLLLKIRIRVLLGGVLHGGTSVVSENGGKSRHVSRSRRSRMPTGLYSETVALRLETWIRQSNRSMGLHAETVSSFAHSKSRMGDHHQRRRRRHRPLEGQL